MPLAPTSDSPLISRKWALLVGLCTSPLFAVFGYFGDLGRGEAAWVCASAIMVAARLLWDLRHQSWYWITFALIVLLHVPLIALVPWPLKQLSYVALLPPAFLDCGIAYGIFKLAKRLFERDSTQAANS